MRDLLDALDERLSALSPATTTDPDPAGARPPRHERRRPRRRGLLGGAAAAGIAAGATFLVAGTSSAGLPILATPPTDASAVRERSPTAAAAGVDFSAAHRFATDAGPGYVVTNEETGTVCVLAPDAAAPGSYGTTCVESADVLERDGVVLQSQGVDRATKREINHFVVVLPEGATEIQVRSGGRTRGGTVRDGILTGSTLGSAVASWSVNGHPEDRDLRLTPSSGRARWMCPDGRLAYGKEPTFTSGANDVAAASRAAMKQACAR